MEWKSVAGIIHNHVLICALVAWLVAQVIKVPLYRIIDKKWDWHRALGSGGMPSSHSAFVAALTVMVGSSEGFDTAIFAVCFIMSAIVMYDATGVRRETGLQSQKINAILRNVFVDGKPISDDDLKELVGHTPFEVYMGAVLGIIVAIIFVFAT